MSSIADHSKAIVVPEEQHSNEHLLRDLLSFNTDTKVEHAKTEVQYLEELHIRVFDWYAQAETKAQAILGINGVFLGLIVSALITASSTNGINYSPLLVIAAFCFYTLSIGFSVMAIWSRGVINNAKLSLVFFGSIANYKSPEALKRDVVSRLSTKEYTEELYRSILEFAKNTRSKHRFVNISALFSGIGLVTTLTIAISTL